MTTLSYDSLIDAGIVLALVQRLSRRGSLVTCRELRRQAGLPKVALDSAVCTLIRTGAIYGARHDHVSTLTDAERAETVHNADAETYGHIGVSIAVCIYFGIS